jgi:UPF0716 family protein affecting phage T7 exclusion
VLSIAKLTPDKDGYPLTTLIADLLTGFLVTVGIVILSLALGGFSFFAPWLIVTPVLGLAGGWARGGTEGNIWLKVCAVCFISLLFLIACSQDFGIVLGLLLIAIPSIAGMWLKRRRLVRASNTYRASLS